MSLSVDNGEKISLLTKIFSTYIVLLPILQYYKSPVPVLNMATFLSLFFCAIFIIQTKGKIRIEKRVFPIVFYLFFITVNIIFTSKYCQYPINENTMEYVRLLVLVSSIIFIGSQFFDCNFALNVLEKVLIASALFMAIQLIFYYLLHKPITGNIPALITVEGYGGAQERATGFYMEPAAYAQSAMLYLSFKLFQQTAFSKKDFYIIIVVVAGILLSGSGQGYAFLLLLAAIWFLHTFFFTSITVKKIITGSLIVVVLLVGIFILFQTPYGQYALSRILPDESASIFSGLGGTALGGRTYTNKQFYTLPQFQQIFGVGFGRVETVIGQYYVNSLYYYLIECGYVSLGVWGIIMLFVIVRGDIRIRVFAIIYIIMFCFSGCARPMMICYYFSFLLCRLQNNKGLKNEFMKR